MVTLLKLEFYLIEPLVVSMLASACRWRRKEEPSDWTRLGINASCAPAFELSKRFSYFHEVTCSLRLEPFWSLVACTLLTGFKAVVKKAHRAL
jgi:hypothetical protein